jgi:hypothetical protein
MLFRCVRGSGEHIQFRRIFLPGPTAALILGNNSKPPFVRVAHTCAAIDGGMLAHTSLMCVTATILRATYIQGYLATPCSIQALHHGIAA